METVDKMKLVKIWLDPIILSYYKQFCNHLYTFLGSQLQDINKLQSILHWEHLEKHLPGDWDQH